MLINYNDLYLYPINYLHDYLIKHHGYSKADMVRFGSIDVIARLLITAGYAIECIRYLRQFEKSPPTPENMRFIELYEYTQANLENYLIYAHGYSDDDLEMFDCKAELTQHIINQGFYEETLGFLKGLRTGE